MLLQLYMHGLLKEPNQKAMHGLLLVSQRMTLLLKLGFLFYELVFAPFCVKLCYFLDQVTQLLWLLIFVLFFGNIGDYRFREPSVYECPLDSGWLKLGC